MPALLYSDTQSVVGYSVIPKCVTLNDPDGCFTLNSALAPVTPALLASETVTFENNCVKTNKDRSTYYQRHKSPAGLRELQFLVWRYKVYADIRGVL